MTTLRPPVTIPIAAVHGMLSGIRARGIENPAWVETLLDEAGIASALMEQTGARVTSVQYAALFRLLMDRLDDEGLGFLSRRLRRGSFALMARSALGSASIEVALCRVAQSFRLLQDDVEMVRLRDGPLIGIGLEFSNMAVARQNFLHELVLRVSWRLLDWLHGSPLVPSGFDFGFDMPPYVAAYTKIFPGPLQFGQPHSAVWFKGTELAAPVRRDERALQAFLRVAPGNVIEPRLNEQTFSARVRTLLQQACPAWPDLATAAQALHQSSSTLQRHLAIEGTTFQSLKDQLRRDMAIVRLNTSAVPMGVLAEELGFAGSAAFQRAFKTWTGSAPGSYRQHGDPGDAESAD